MDKYKYIINIDTDELIMSNNQTTYPELMEDLEKVENSEVLRVSKLEIRVIKGFRGEFPFHCIDNILNIFRELDAGLSKMFCLWMKCKKKFQ